ncbi:MAG: hypothetical protein MUE60_06940 [Candidatus Eisenbacteria bacterium]|jgi:hypothetical protein|nr:hypothetical protein [Candidatus Eisenbacteria bacterium]
MKIRCDALIVTSVAVALVTGCAVNPHLVYRMNPVADETVWLQGTQYARVDSGPFAVVSAFDRSYRGHAIFDVEISSRCSTAVTVSPEFIHCYWLRDPEGGVAGTPQFAVDPERVLAQTELALSREEASYGSATGIDATLTLMDLFVDLATVGTKTREQREDEREDGEAEDAERTRRDTVHRTRMTDLSELRRTWEVEALRTTTLPPGFSVRGRVHIPVPKPEPFLRLCIPLGDVTVCQIFEIRYQRP